MAFLSKSARQRRFVAYWSQNRHINVHDHLGFVKIRNAILAFLLKALRRLLFFCAMEQGNP
jgi:hypothetical protein